jgi:hypothetical protein
MYLPLATAVLFQRSLPQSVAVSTPAAPSPTSLLWPGLILLLGGGVGALVSRWRRQVALAPWIGERSVPTAIRSLALAADLAIGGGCVAGMVLIVGAMQGPGTARLTLPLVGGVAALFLAVGTASFLEAQIVARCLDSPAARLRLHWVGVTLSVIFSAAAATVGVLAFASPEWLRLAVGSVSFALVLWILMMADRTLRVQR